MMKRLREFAGHVGALIFQINEIGGVAAHVEERSALKAQLENVGQELRVARGQLNQAEKERSIQEGEYAVRYRRRELDGRTRNDFRRVSRRIDYGESRQRNVAFERPRFYAGTY